MNHFFDVDVAVKYGVNQAIILSNLYFWIEKNRANNKHYYDGKYWTYNSKKAFSELLPYMSERQIDYSLNKLIDSGLIIKGNYNKLKYDRTLWYSITDKGLCILQNCEMKKPKLQNEKTEIVEPIPDINSNINSNINLKESKRERDTFDEIIERYTEDEYIRGLLIDWLKVRKVKRAANTNRAIELNINKLDRLAQESKLSVKKYLEEVISRGWTAFYKINDFNKSNGVSERNNANKDYSGDWD